MAKYEDRFAEGYITDKDRIVMLQGRVDELEAEKARADKYLQELEGLVDHKADFSVAQKRIAKLEKALRDGVLATMALCSCGGGDAETGCDACKIYHAMKVENTLEES